MPSARRIDRLKRDFQRVIHFTSSTFSRSSWAIYARSVTYSFDYIASSLSFAVGTRLNGHILSGGIIGCWTLYAGEYVLYIRWLNCS